ncbi:MAG: hypothetical protein K8F25_15775, partial [Fimbriimonadaceae bacterium]|nr:hypothetical protein [Alphaproteobacteria bacterium]
YSRASQVKTAMQTALDSTALHLGLLPQDSSQAVLEAEAANYFAANYQGESDVNLGTITVLKDGPAIKLVLNADLPTMFMTIANIDKMDVGAVSEVLLGGGTIEIAMVLDNSGSMSGSKLSALKTAARGLVETLYDALPPNSTDLSFSLVPFATFVDIGENNANASWMDTQARSSIHRQDFNGNVGNRFDFFNNISNVQWEGCVEARPYPHDVQDTPPDSSVPDTLYVPAFAPDEPGDAGRTWPYGNSYLDDSTNGNDRIKQEHTHKYASGAVAVPALWGTQYNFGPSLLCRQSNLMPLTTSENAIDTALQNMFAKGGTNIVQGLVWGWRTLSPTEPFTQGRAYNDNRNQKILILLTDGQNSYNGANNQNHSLYMAYGYSKHGRLGTTSSSSSTLNDALDTRTAEACVNIKATGILVYTITFNLNHNATIQLMRNCATASSYYYNSPSVSDLDDVFENIAAKLLKLRLTK